eukprot:9099135-Pyramimonas_sp.AAC.1
MDQADAESAGSSHHGPTGRRSLDTRMTRPDGSECLSECKNIPGVRTNHPCRERICPGCEPIVHVKR